MADPTGAEVLMWALINRARLDPGGEAARYGINLNEGPPKDFNTGQPITLTFDSKQPLAWNTSLFAVADQHSADMVAAQQLYHNAQAVHEQNLHNAGYQFSWWGENVSESMPITAQFTLQDAIYEQAEDLFVDTFSGTRGHRVNILNDNFQEVGVGQVTANFDGGNRSILTQDFGRPAASGQFLTGIAYNDNDHDNFYSIGEGRGGITVATSSGSPATAGAGNYSLAIGTGVQTVTFSGGDLAAPVSVQATVAAGRNAMIDLIGQSTVETSVSLTAVSNVSKIIGLGNTGLTLTGNGADNVIVSALGNDTINGAGGTDTAAYHGNRASYTITNNGNGNFTVSGLDGTDTLTGIEKLQFADQTVVLSGPAPVAGSVAIGDVSITEGNSGTKLATFTVVRSGGTAAFDVNVATANGSATTADGDYVAKSTTLHFGANVNSQTFQVTINGDTKVEGNETFTALLSGATAGATISDGSGLATIVNDDSVAPVAGAVAVSDVTITEGNAGTKVATFTVTRGAGTAAFDVNFATSNGSATTADGDYVAKSGTLHFGANVNSQTFSVVINGDTKLEANETFNVKLSGTTNGATIHDGTGVGTIVNDDVASANHAPQDFNADGFSDVLWHSDQGKVVMWQMNGTHIASNKTVGSAATSWHIAGTEDFNGDHMSDVLWRNDNGSVAMWQMNGSQIVANKTIGSSGTNWHVAATDDFNGDGKGDVLWANTAGTVSMWQMNGTQIAANKTVGTVANHWDIIGTGDFNGDHKADILLQSDTGSVAMWQMNGAQVSSVKTFGSVGAGWHFGGADDFSGDGKADILWYNDQGKVAMWQMNGTQIASNKTVGFVSTDWNIADIGDYNKDGHSDILWHNDNGAVAMWQMNGAQILDNHGVGSGGSGWHII